ncbi:MAG: peptide deformylase [Gemmatimonadetes bacterium]|nr:peptide deformylase [Gemmatimonadota bacterium]NIU75871.1 peptide deformylase [Gammaproteobacteria bacterium]NIP80588.1 peptide deformylase [Gemmatimonadota bacterium]NIQ55669.1 peptide deformylase [Gemmatimonadota bacterium]NIX45503.1 peptide deformylase [Gemmatimonadota bacterium]
MASLELRMMGDPILREEATEVEEVDEDIRRLAQDMFDTMYEADGVGLAANQVGVRQRLIVVDPREDGVTPRALVNPRVVGTGDETDRAEEGCLSIPGLREVVERKSTVTVEATDLDGEPVRIEAGGLHARVLLHEIDHLDGVLFIDRVSPLKRKMLLKKWKKALAERESAATGGR